MRIALRKCLNLDAEYFVSKTTDGKIERAYVQLNTLEYPIILVLAMLLHVRCIVWLAHCLAVASRISYILF